MAAGFRNSSPLGLNRSYCVPMRGGQRFCGPLDYAEDLIRERLASGEDPDALRQELGPTEQRLLDDIRERMMYEAITRRMNRAAELRAAIVRVANREYDNWHDPDIFETQPAGRQLIREYWRVGVRRNVTDAQASSADWQSDNPWSAAFVSYVVREAGAGSDFQYSWAHATYARAAIDNRLSNSPTPFRGFRLHERPLEPGDIVVKERGNSGANYDNVRRGMFTHGDIITAVQNNHAIAIGGNVGAADQNVDDKQLSVDADKHLTDDYFVVIKI